jgi:hypothetical protein
MTLKDQLEKLAKEYPLVLHTDAGRLFSTVRRMKAEKKMGIPIFLRTDFAISTKNGKAANAMTKDEWEEFYNALSERLRGDYPELDESLFSPNKTGKGIPDAAELTGPCAVEIANEYARNHSSALSQPGATFGGWTNKAESKIYLDVSQNINDREAAVNAGKARNQIAIWDVKSAEISTGGTGK